MELTRFVDFRKSDEAHELTQQIKYSPPLFHTYVIFKVTISKALLSSVHA